MAPADLSAMRQTIAASPLDAKYGQVVDRESAREKLAAKLDTGAAKANQERDQASGGVAYPKKPSTPRPREQGNILDDIMKSSVTKQIARTAAREIVRGVFGIGRR